MCPDRILFVLLSKSIPTVFLLFLCFFHYFLPEIIRAEFVASVGYIYSFLQKLKFFLSSLCLIDSILLIKVPVKLSCMFPNSKNCSKLWQNQLRSVKFVESWILMLTVSKSTMVLTVLTLMKVKVLCHDKVLAHDTNLYGTSLRYIKVWWMQKIELVKICRQMIGIVFLHLWNGQEKWYQLNRLSICNCKLQPSTLQKWSGKVFPNIQNQVLKISCMQKENDNFDHVITMYVVFFFRMR